MAFHVKKKSVLKKLLEMLHRKVGLKKPLKPVLFQHFTKLVGVVASH